MKNSQTSSVRTSSFNQKYKSPLIKWYNTNMTYEEKYKLGLLTYPEYLEWQRQLSMGIDPDAAKAADSSSVLTTSSNTFWKNDEEERTNMSSDAYTDFLANNNIDVSNKSAVDFDALYNQVNAKPEEPQPEPVFLTQDEILANVNRDIQGGDNRVLSEEEIAALFAAAGVN